MITLLDTGSLLNPLTQQTSTATHHRACLILDEYDNEVIAHIKAFPADSHGLANELAGWTLHRAAGIDVAPRVWIIILTSAELNSLFPDAHWGKGSEWPCLAVEHVEGTPIAARSADTWADELSAWHCTAAAIAMGEWLAEIDGNAGNLLNTRPGEFICIDFADILYGQHWTPKLLKKSTNAPLYNKGLHICWGGVANEEQRQEIRQAAAKHAIILKENWPTIAHWWRALLKTEKECQAAHDFLHARSSVAWMTKRI